MTSGKNQKLNEELNTMKFNLKNNLLTITILSCIAASIGCSTSAKPGSTTETNKSNTSVEKTTAEKPDKNPTSPNDIKTSTGDKIGVPECDNYIEKYEVCISGKVPEAARAQMKTSFEMTRKSWKDLAANPQTKASLASACKQATEMAKQSMSAYACEW